VPINGYDSPDPCPDLATARNCPDQCDLKCTYSRIYNAIHVSGPYQGAVATSSNTVTQQPEPINTCPPS